MNLQRYLSMTVMLALFHLSGEVFALDTRCTVDNGLVPDQSRCDTFLICILGNVRRTVTCSNGLLFDAKEGKCNFKEKVDCGSRSRKNPETETCIPSEITVTIVAENDQVEPRFAITTSLSAPRQSLRNFLLMAAGQYESFRFKSREIGSFGEFVTSFNGLESNPATLTAWVPFLFSDKQISEGIKTIMPRNNSVYLFKFFSFRDGCTECEALSRQILT